jgi:hypothetical protein
MPTYTVHEPPLRDGETVSDPERFVFVRDGFHFWAFVLAPLWILLHRLWLVLVLYVALSFALAAVFFVTGAPGSARFVIALLLALLIGFEAATLRRWTLARRGWKTAGIVVADDEELGERRFFAEWLAREPDKPQASAEPVFARPIRRGAPSASDVIGLFPEPGGWR